MQAEKLIQIAMMLPSAAFIGWLIGAWADGRLHQSMDRHGRDRFWRTSRAWFM